MKATLPWTEAEEVTFECEPGTLTEHKLKVIRDHGVTHYCGAPIVHLALINAPEAQKQGISHRVHCLVAGAAPPVAVRLRPLRTASPLM